MREGRPRRRSVAEMLAAQPTPEGKLVYGLERIAALEDQMARVLELVGSEARELAFARDPRLERFRHRWR